MPDYGHPVEFGTSIVPYNRDPGATVEMARLTEYLGLEYATFQDHPYQPAYLETWTLMSWVLARTTTLRVAANVHNLPLRPPAVLARSAASLDLLSGGRFELGLGAGAFWEAIAAMGGPRLSPGQSVEALEEAIEVIRALWDTTERGGVFFNGRHYRVRGAKRGPGPAHPMQVWLGAYRPRMLRLVGRVADGWWPSLPYMKVGDYARGNAVIDAAAVAEGRDPRGIRRILNVRAGTASAGELLPFARDDGVSLFVAFAEDPADIERFATDVVPALRQAIARERR